jgi:hypothetical protein
MDRFYREMAEHFCWPESISRALGDKGAKHSMTD